MPSQTLPRPVVAGQIENDSVTESICPLKFSYALGVDSRISEAKPHLAGTTLPLWCFSFAYNVMHHNSLFGTTQGIKGTRLADWFDMLTPMLVVLPLLWFMLARKATRAQWLIACVGGIVYVEGHGIHLAANSIGNSGTVGPDVASTVHLWDEVVGHYLWFGGLAVLLLACAKAASKWVSGTPIRMMLVNGGISGITWATNGLEGGTAIFSLLLAGIAVSTSVRRRSTGLAAFLGAGGSVALIILSVYGIVHGGFPQPSTLSN
jgi:hypothetical protein